MNAELLHQCFAATLESDRRIRVQAEQQLKQIALSPGFFGACLDVISDNTATPSPVRKATALYFKNRIVSFWSSEDSNKIDDDEKPLIKERLIPALTFNDHGTRQQLIPVLRVLISYEFPQRWPLLLPVTLELCQQVSRSENSIEKLSQVYCGLLCFSEICRKFRWVTNEDRKNDLDGIITEVFPHILEIGNSIVASFDVIDEMLAEMLKLILKAYKFVTYYDLPLPLQDFASFKGWAEFHGSVLNMLPPAYVLDGTLTEDERVYLQISKCYKWSIANLYRLFTRYASDNLSRKFSYVDFQQAFCENFLPHLIPNILGIIEQWCTNSRWIGSTTMYYLLQFLSQCVTQKTSWPLLKPYFENLVSHLIFPLLISSDRDLEVFEDDPQEYIHSNLDIYPEIDKPDTAALGLLVTLIDKRRNLTLDPVVAFTYNKLTSLQEFPETVETSKEKEGALRVLSGIAHYLLLPESAYFGQMEDFMINLVFPNLTSNFGFLKARTLEVVLHFPDLDFKREESLIMLKKGILDTFVSSDKEYVGLPVMLECALAIQSFMHLEPFKEAMTPNIVPVMSNLLRLSEQIDSDALSMVMQECVETFSEQLQPFGMELMSKLVEQFMKLAPEIRDASLIDVDDFNDTYEDQSDKVMAAIGFLNTMITVMLSFENSIETCMKLEQIFSPALQFILENELEDFLTEAGELMENSTFLTRSISPTMWKNFQQLYRAFEDGMALMYIEELSQCLHNFLVYGQEDVRMSPELAGLFYSIINIIIEEEDGQVGYNDLVFALELSQTFVLSLRENSSIYLESIITKGVTISQLIEKESPNIHNKNNSLNVNVNNLIVASIIYNLDLTLLILPKIDYLVSFFENWTQIIPSLKRVYDLKLSITGLIKLASHEGLLNFVPENFVKKIGHSFAVLMGQLPKSLEALERKRKAFSGIDQHFDFSLEENESQDVSQDFQRALSEGFYDKDDDTLAEDPLATTPLDGVDVFQLFKEFTTSLTSTDNRYALVFGDLDASEKATLISIFNMTH